MHNDMQHGEVDVLILNIGNGEENTTSANHIGQVSFSFSLPLPLPYLPFKAMTLEAGFMIAESAVMGLRIGLAESARSMMIT